MAYNSIKCSFFSKVFCEAAKASRRTISTSAVFSRKRAKPGNINFADFLLFRDFNLPTHQNDLPRVAGIASFMRIPVSSLEETASLDACVVGVPVDTATSNRPGTRFGPREIRTESVMVRPRSNWTGENPFTRLQIADIGDVVANLYNVKVACDSITEQYK